MIEVTLSEMAAHATAHWHRHAEALHRGFSDRQARRIAWQRTNYNISGYSAEDQKSIRLHIELCE